MGGGEERMALGIMQEQQRPAAQYLAGTPDQAAWDQVIGVHRFLVPIEVEGGRWLAWLRLLGRPKPRRPGASASVSVSSPPARATCERNRSVCRYLYAR